MIASTTAPHRSGLLVRVAVGAVSSAQPKGLDARELRRWAEYRDEGARARFASGVDLLARLCEEVTGRQLPRLRRCPGCGSQDHGPVTVEGHSVSISHSGDRVAVALGPDHLRIGIDIERLRDFGDGVSRLAFSRAERSADLEDPRGPRHAATVRWVRKEAVLKAARVGITVPLPDLEISAASSEPRIVRWRGPGAPAELRATAAAVHDVACDAAGDYRIAVAIIGDDAHDVLVDGTRRPLRRRRSIHREGGEDPRGTSMSTGAEQSASEQAPKLTAEAVATAWSDVLQHAGIDVDSEVFSLGADSIRVFHLAERLAALGHAVEAELIFAARTPRELARAVAAEEHAGPREGSHDATGAMLRLDLAEVVEDLDEPERDASAPMPLQDRAGFLVTDAMDAVGIALVEALLARTSAPICALVPRTAAGDGAEAFERRASAAGVVLDARRVVVVESPRGTTPQDIPIAVDTVLHNPRLTSESGDYASVRNRSVVMASELIRGIEHLPTAEVHLVASTSSHVPVSSGAFVAAWAVEQIVRAAGHARLRTVVTHSAEATDLAIARKVAAAVVSAIGSSAESSVRRIGGELAVNPGEDASHADARAALARAMNLSGI